MARRTVQAITLVALALLLPIQALAATCLRPSPFPNILVLELAGGGSRYFLLAGEDLGACTNDVNTGRMPLHGTAHMRADGRVALGLSTLSSDGETRCNPYWYQGTLTPPGYSGSGFVGFLSGTKVAVRFEPVACPADLRKPEELR